MKFQQIRGSICFSGKIPAFWGLTNADARAVATDSPFAVPHPTHSARVTEQRAPEGDGRGFQLWWRCGGGGGDENDGGGGGDDDDECIVNPT